MGASAACDTITVRTTSATAAARGKPFRIAHWPRLPNWLQSPVCHERAARAGRPPMANALARRPPSTTEPLAAETARTPYNKPHGRNAVASPMLAAFAVGEKVDDMRAMARESRDAPGKRGRKRPHSSAAATNVNAITQGKYVRIDVEKAWLTNVPTPPITMPARPYESTRADW